MMKCPHCLENFYTDEKVIDLGGDIDGQWRILRDDCPACNRMVLKLFQQTIPAPGTVPQHITRLFKPKTSLRPPCPQEVPETFSEDYNEACLVLPDSSKASAALSRRCLQNILRGIGGIKPSNLAKEIQEAIEKGNLPSHIVEAIDAIRVIGNFAAHPIKSKRTGEILPVELGEAEWNLDVLEALFDFYFVQPALLVKKKETLNEKLNEAGKPPLK